MVYHKSVCLIVCSVYMKRTLQPSSTDCTFNVLQGCMSYQHTFLCLSYFHKRSFQIYIYYIRRISASILMNLFCLSDFQWIKIFHTLLVFGGIALKLLNMNQAHWIAFHKLLTILCPDSFPITPDRTGVAPAGLWTFLLRHAFLVLCHHF